MNLTLATITALMLSSINPPEPVHPDTYIQAATYDVALVGDTGSRPLLQIKAAADTAAWGTPSPRPLPPLLNEARIRIKITIDIS